MRKFTSTPAKACTKRKEKGSWQCRHLDTVAHEDLEKILEEIDKDVELNEKGDKMPCGFPIDSSSLSNLLAFF